MADIEKQKILQELGGISEYFYDELAKEFFQQLGEQLRHLKEALESCDLEKIRKKAHFIKGASGNLRIQRVFELAYELEVTAADGSDMRVVAAKIGSIEEFFKGIKNQ